MRSTARSSIANRKKPAAANSASSAVSSVRNNANGDMRSIASAMDYMEKRPEHPRSPQVACFPSGAMGAISDLFGQGGSGNVARVFKAKQPWLPIPPPLIERLNYGRRAVGRPSYGRSGKAPSVLSAIGSTMAIDPRWLRAIHRRSL